MIFKKVLIDTNICLDAAQKRKPFYSNALTIVEHAQAGRFSGFVAAHSFDTLFYILNKENNKKAVYTILSGFRRAFKVASVTQSVIDKAIESNWNDFEDAIHYQTAWAAGCEVIISRNKKDFSHSELSVLSPLEFLEQV